MPLREINFDRLRREAAEKYEKEAAKRRKAGDQAREDAERLAYEARKQDIADQNVGLLVADQDVHVFKGDILVAKLPPGSLWEPLSVPQGMGLRTLLWSPSLQHHVEGPYFQPGEWTLVR